VLSKRLAVDRFSLGEMTRCGTAALSFFQRSERFEQSPRN
jgi:hypothetical protein